MKKTDKLFPKIIVILLLLLNGGNIFGQCPTVYTPYNQFRCNGEATDVVIFMSDTPSGVTYNWTNNNTAIGLLPAGTGDIASFTATNPTNAPITATITVTPITSGCTGVSASFTITVNPTPSVTSVTDGSRCGAGTVILRATPSAGVVNWYTSTTGGAPVHTGTSYVTPNISATTSYWVEAVDDNCTSALPRTQVTAIIQDPTISIEPVLPVCEGLTAEVRIHPTPSNATITWSDPTATPNNIEGTSATVKPPYTSGTNHHSPTTPTL